jgi:hypothetical protein
MLCTANGGRSLTTSQRAFHEKQKNQQCLKHAFNHACSCNTIFTEDDWIATPTFNGELQYGNWSIDFISRVITRYNETHSPKVNYMIKDLTLKSSNTSCIRRSEILSQLKILLPEPGFLGLIVRTGEHTGPKSGHYIALVCDANGMILRDSCIQEQEQLTYAAVVEYLNVHQVGHGLPAHATRTQGVIAVFSKLLAYRSRQLSTELQEAYVEIQASAPAMPSGTTLPLFSSFHFIKLKK